MRFLGLAAAATFALGATVASAATIVIHAEDAAAYTALGAEVNNGTVLGAGWAFDATGLTQTGSINAQWRSPYDFGADTADGTGGVPALAGWESLEYFSVGPTTSEPVTLTFGGTVANELTLLWGSVDEYNHIEFLFGGSVVDTVDGGDLFAQGATTKAAGGGGALVTISDVTFDAVKFWSRTTPGEDGGETAAFEFANLSIAPVPLPAGGLLLLFGLGGLAVLRKRRDVA